MLIWEETFWLSWHFMFLLHSSTDTPDAKQIPVGGLSFTMGGEALENTSLQDVPLNDTQEHANGMLGSLVSLFYWKTYIKGARAQKIGLKCTNLKIWFSMRVILFVSVDKKIISPNNEWYIGNVWVCAHFSSKQAHGTYCLYSFTQLFRLLGKV